jgi:hypothetical protein
MDTQIHKCLLLLLGNYNHNISQDRQHTFNVTMEPLHTKSAGILNSTKQNFYLQCSNAFLAIVIITRSTQIPQLLCHTMCYLCNHIVGISVKVAQGSDQGVDKQQTQAVNTSSPFMEKNRLRAFVTRPSAKTAGELLNLSTNQLRLLPGLLTAHFHFKKIFI